MIWRADPETQHQNGALRVYSCSSVSFPSARHLTSWAGRCPGNHESGGKRRGGATPELIPLSAPAVRRLVLAMDEAAEQRPFRLARWRWRRARQAVAARCHAARRALHQATQPPAPAALAQFSLESVICRFPMSGKTPPYRFRVF